MILVELTRDMRPQRAGDDLLLPDDTALAMLASGQARNPRDRFGKPVSMDLPAPRRKYVTK